MRRLPLLFVATALAALTLAGAPGPAAAITLTPDDINWEMVGTDVVRFQLHFHNDGTTLSEPISGTMYSQEFGAFLPYYGTIGTFDVPPIEPESFFDVFFEVPLAQLPPLPAGGGGGGGAGLVATEEEAPCPPPIWIGNVDVTWTDPADPSGPVHVNKHFGVIGVYPGMGWSCIHVITGCVGNITWNITHNCPAGWAAALFNFDWTAPGALLPPGWHGWLCISAAANIPVGSQCCVNLNLTCNGVPVTIKLCAVVCDLATPTQQGTWGRIKMLYR